MLDSEDVNLSYSSSCVIFLYRYRISGSSLLSAMDQSYQVSYSDKHSDDKEHSDGSYVNGNGEKSNSSMDSSHLQVNDEMHSRVDDRGGRVQPTVDVAEIIRRWTHALQRIHKQSLLLVFYFFVWS